MANVISIAVRMIDQTKGGLTQPIRSLKDLEGVISKLTPAALALATTLGAAFVAVAGHAINVADEMNKMSQKAGLSTETFSALSYAAELANVDNTQLSKGLKELGGSMLAAQTAGSEQAKMFEAIGVSTRDANGALLTTDQMLLRLADKFLDTADGVGKVAAATAIFGGKLGQEMIPFLNQGAAGIRELTSEAEMFGQTISGKTGAAAEGFNDSLTRLKKLVEGFVKVFVGELLPMMERTTTDFIEWIKQSGALAVSMTGVKVSAEGVIDVIKFFAVYVQSSISALRAIVDMLLNFGAIGKDVWMLQIHGARNMANVLLEIAKGPFGSVTQAVTDGTREMRKDFAQIEGDGKTALMSVGTAAQTVADGMRNVIMQGLGINKFIGDMKAAASSAIFGRPASSGVKGQMSTTSTGNTDILPSGYTMEAYQLDQQMMIATKQAMLQAFGVKMTIADQSKAQLDIQMAQEEMRYQERMKQISDLAMAETENYPLIENAMREHAARVKAIHADIGKSVRQSYSTMVDSTASILGSFAQIAQAHGKKSFGMWQALSYGQAVISTLAGATRAFAEHPWPASAFIAAAVTAAGFANVAQIAATKPPQAHAGASYIPEESTYLLQAGERVIAPEQNQDLTQFLNGGGMTRVTINLDGREILNYVGAATRDGNLVIDARSVV